MFIQLHQLKGFDSEVKKRVTERWETKEGKIHSEYIKSLIRKGAGENLLQSDYQNGKFNGFLDNDWDLRGLHFFEENITCPTADNFQAIDLSYSRFWHTTFVNCTFHAFFDFARFYNCKFENCFFTFATFYDSYFEKCAFNNCDFIENCKFTNCEFLTSEFNNFYFPNNIFEDCKFNSSFALTDPSPKPSNVDWTNNFENKHLQDFFISVKDAYAAGGANDKQWKYFYKAKQAQTRYNSKNKFKKYVNLIFNEILIGYGERPFNCLIISIILIFIFAFLYTFTGLGFTFYDINGDAQVQIINYNIDFVNFFKEINNITYIKKLIFDFGNFLYFSVATFTTVGYGDITPINPWGKILTGIEMFLGVTLVGAWVATFFRKIIR